MADSRRQDGFTLLEVMVALVIVALGLMAAFGQVNQSLTVAGRLRDKTLAHWVAVNELTRVRLATRQSGQLPALGKVSDEVEMARTNWRFTVEVKKTEGGPDFRSVEVTVAFADRPDTAVSSISGYLALPSTATGAPGGGGPNPAGWYCSEATG